MATINYCTLEFPKELVSHLELLQECHSFKVYRYKVTPGIIFRIPNGVEPGDVCHFFLEHELNLSNTLKTGTLTLKVQVTILPVNMGIFSGFHNLQGSYKTDYFDEEEYSYGDERFVPDYDRSTKKIVPLPVGGHSNLYEYLNTILFKQSNDIDILHKYAVSLGCQKEALRDKIKFIAVPEYGSKVNSDHSKNAFKQSEILFDLLANQRLELIPPQQ